jgi:hypothetical protein
MAYVTLILSLIAQVVQAPIDPAYQLFSGLGLGGVALFVFWKLATKALCAWKDTSKTHAELELEKTKQAHDGQTRLAASIECLSDRVHENTTATLQSVASVKEFTNEAREITRRMERLSDSLTPDGGTRVSRLG